MQMHKLNDQSEVEIIELIPERIRQSRLEMISAKELQKKKLPPINWIVKDLLPEGLTILAGRPKLGKSWMAMNIAISVAEGNKALGYFDTAKHKVLYIALEDNDRRLQSRINNILNSEIDKNASENLFLMTEKSKLPKLSENGLEEIEKIINDEPEIKLIIIDTLGRIRGNTKRHDNNIYQADYELSSGLQGIAMKHQLCIMLIHHTKKGGEENVFDEISGTTGLPGGSDTMMVIKKVNGQSTLNVTGRDIVENSFSIVFDDQIFTWNVVGKVEEVRTTAERQAILDTLKTHNREMRSSEIAKIIEKSPSNTSKLLSKLMTEGRVESPRYGSYVLKRTDEMFKKPDETKKEITDQNGLFEEDVI